MLCDRDAITSVLCVSQYSHKIASTETKGTEAKIAPMIALRLETTEIVTRITAEMNTFNIS